MSVTYAELETSTSPIVNNSRVTIKDRMRGLLGIEPGDKIKWFFNGEKVLVIPVDNSDWINDDSKEAMVSVDFAKVISETVVVSSNNQVTVPKDIRDLMGVRHGDAIKLVYDGDEVVAVPIEKEQTE